MLDISELNLQLALWRHLHEIYVKAKNFKNLPA